MCTNPNFMKTSFKVFAAVGALFGWFAVVFQFWLMMQNRTRPVPGTIIQFFSYFTILTNTIVAIYFTLMLRGAKGWVARASTATALAVYIIVVGLVYNLILRQLWEPKGLQKMVDEVLHTVNPLYFLVYWVMFVRKDELKWKHVFQWLAYPFVYCIYVLIRGGLTDLYPYPFIDVTKLGMGTVLLNCVMLFAGFILLSLLFIGIAKTLTARRGKEQRAALD